MGDTGSTFAYPGQRRPVSRITLSHLMFDS